jgi:hypothetical protein
MRSGERRRRVKREEDERKRWNGRGKIVNENWGERDQRKKYEEVGWKTAEKRGWRENGGMKRKDRQIEMV